MGKAGGVFCKSGDVRVGVGGQWSVLMLFKAGFRWWREGGWRWGLWVSGVLGLMVLERGGICAGDGRMGGLCCSDLLCEEVGVRDVKRCLRLIGICTSSGVYRWWTWILDLHLLFWKLPGKVACNQSHCEDGIKVDDL